MVRERHRPPWLTFSNSVTRMIHVLATIQVTPGSRQAFLDAFHQLVPQVHEEAGCLKYQPAIDLDSGLPLQPAIRDDVVTVVEEWEDLEALKAHLQAPHMAAYREKVKDLVVSTTVHILEPATE